MHRSIVHLAGLGLLTVALGARAAGEPAKDPEGIVSLSGSASVEVPKDWMSVTFSVTREGADAATVQAALKQALDAALALARKAQKPNGGVQVETGAFSLQPRYNAKGAMTGWTGSTDLLVQGRDMPAIADLAGRISTLTIGRVAYSLSREAREKVEADVAAQAIARFRGQAATYAKAFGYGSFAIREVSVQLDNPQPPMPRAYAMKTLAADAVESLPVEAGNGTVTASVNGTVQMK